MPQERESQSPTVSAADWSRETDKVSRGLAAARLIAARQITGIPHRPYLLGQSDHSPVIRSLTDFCEKVYKMLDATNNTDFPMSADLEDAASVVYTALEEFE